MTAATDKAPAHSVARVRDGIAAANHVEQFRDAIRATGLTPPDVINDDGELHRFASNGKRGDDSGWYVLHDDAISAGSFGCWRTGLSQTWRVDAGRKLSPAEAAALRDRADPDNRKRDAGREQRHVEARDKATAVLRAATGDPATHPYAELKDVSFGLLVRRGAWPQRGWSDALLIRMYDARAEEGKALAVRLYNIGARTIEATDAAFSRHPEWVAA